MPAGSVAEQAQKLRTRRVCGGFCVCLPKLGQCPLFGCHAFGLSLGRRSDGDRKRGNLRCMNRHHHARFHTAATRTDGGTTSPRPAHVREGPALCTRSDTHRDHHQPGHRQRSATRAAVVKPPIVMFEAARPRHINPCYDAPRTNAVAAVSSSSANVSGGSRCIKCPPRAPPSVLRAFIFRAPRRYPGHGRHRAR